jgi:galactokinase
VPTPAGRRVVRAPGRVNLIGDHTDYQAGLCLPIAIDKEVRIAFAPRADGRVQVRSAAFPTAVEITADGSVPAAGLEPAWGRTVAAVLTVLARQGRDPVGFDADITTTVPVGSGLSSSAALEVAVALTAAAVAEFPIGAAGVALAAQAAEHLASGVPCGVMDQLASVSGRAGHALLLDCRTLEITPVPIPAGVEVLVIHSGLERRLETSAYADRRAACETAAARLGVEMLRDATIEQVADDPIARHVVTENARVSAFVTALRERDLATCGALMLASHRSLRDDFAVSTPELDLLVNLAVETGAYGARLTGAGFGGCVVALVRSGTADSVAEAVCAQYRSETGRQPDAFTVSAVDGAGFVATS